MKEKLGGYKLVRKMLDLASNFDVFEFNVDSLGKISTQAHPITKNENVIIYLNGIIYNKSKSELLRGFESEGLNFIKKLQGSFVIVLVLNGDTHVLTDSFNSKKMYYKKNENSLILSNDISRISSPKDKLNLKGVSSYISNGSMINDITIFDEVRSFSRGTINSVVNQELVSVCYRPIKYVYDRSYDYSLLKEELKKILIESIAKRIKLCEKPVLSLSAGWDARGILGILAEEEMSESLECFSYASSNSPNPNTDGAISKRMSEKYGFEHNVVKSYEGDIVKLINNNINYGKSIAYFCYELDSWMSLEEKNSYTDIFVGDEIFGWIDVPLHSKENVLDSIEVRRPESINWLRDVLPKKSFIEIETAIKSSLDELYSKADNQKDMHDKKDFLYVEHRINNVLMPWRELISSKVGVVHNPYIDEELLKFVQKLPPNIRKNKKLFKDTISELYPELFQIPKASDTGHREDWENEVYRSKDKLIKYVMNTDSALDELIPKDSVIKLINMQQNKMEKVKTFTVKGINYIRKRSGYLDNVMNKIIGVRTPRTESITVLLRILTLRGYLIIK